MMSLNISLIRKSLKLEKPIKEKVITCSLKRCNLQDPVKLKLTNCLPFELNTTQRWSLWNIVAALSKVYLEKYKTTKYEITENLC